MKIVLIEPDKTGGPGAVGALSVLASIQAAGYPVDHVQYESSCRPQGQMTMFGGRVAARLSDYRGKASAVFLSVLYVRQWLRVAGCLRELGLEPLRANRHPGDPVVVLGGQSSIAPAPLAPFVDLVCLGDGEETAVAVARAVATGAPAAEIAAQFAGEAGYWAPGVGPRRLERAVAGGTNLGRRLLSGPQDRRATVETARGCKSRCAFCPIGWAGGPYREADPADVMSAIEKAKGSALNLYAPDYSAVSYALDADKAMESNGCKHSGKDARLDLALRHIRKGGTVRSFSFGIEGASERIRRAIGKPLAHSTIVSTMAELARGGVRRVKWYLIGGFPGESQADREEFTSLLEDVARVYPNMLDISPTPLQSVPHTPLEMIDNRYDEAAGQWLARLRNYWRGHDRGAGSRIIVQPAKSQETHESDAALQRQGEAAAEFLLDGRASRWREGLDVDLLQHPNPTHWDFVEPTGQGHAAAERQRLAGVAHYERTMGLSLAKRPRLCLEGGVRP